LVSSLLFQHTKNYKFKKYATELSTKISKNVHLDLTNNYDFDIKKQFVYLELATLPIYLFGTVAYAWIV